MPPSLLLFTPLGCDERPSLPLPLPPPPPPYDTNKSVRENHSTTTKNKNKKAVTHPITLQLHTLFHPPPPPPPPPLPSPRSYVVAKAGDKYVARYADVEMQIEWGSALAQHQLELVDTSRGQQVCVFYRAHPGATITLVVSHGNALDAGGGGCWGLNVPVRLF